MHDIYFTMQIEQMRSCVMRRVRELYPNFDEMPDERQAECVADLLDDGLGRWLKRILANKLHSDAYEAMLDAA